MHLYPIIINTVTAVREASPLSDEFPHKQIVSCVATLLALPLSLAIPLTLVFLFHRLDYPKQGGLHQVRARAGQVSVPEN
jgi:hypothetical protein